MAGVFDYHNLGVIGGDAGHQKGEAIARGGGSGENIGGYGRGALGADFYEGGGD